MGWQIFVKIPSGRSITIDVEQTECIFDIKQKIQDKEGILPEAVRLQFQGRQTFDDDTIASLNIVRESTLLVLGRLHGGKGGFGAMLRAKAKQAGAKKTTDFGACRDLSGRRLRHVNDEIILQKWKEAKDNGKAFDVEETTPTGIDLWYLQAPSWAEGIKQDRKKIFLKNRKKTIICMDWQRAREHGPAPAGAPAWWGCPRGIKCNFAHGEEDLQSELKQQVQQTHAEEQQQETHKRREEYVEQVHQAEELAQVNIADAVTEGLLASKRARKAERRAAKSAASVAGESNTAATTANYDDTTETNDEFLPLADF